MSFFGFPKRENYLLLRVIIIAMTVISVVKNIRFFYHNNNALTQVELYFLQRKVFRYENLVFTDFHHGKQCA